MVFAKVRSKGDTTRVVRLFCFGLVAYSPGTVKSIHFKLGKNC